MDKLHVGFFCLFAFFRFRSFVNYIVKLIKGLGGLGFGRGDNMGINIGRGTGLGMAQLMGHNDQGYALGNHNAGIGMAQ